MQFMVQNMRLTRTDHDTVVQGEEQMAYFTFDETWNHRVKTAGFVRDGAVVFRAAIHDGKCLVPPAMADVPSFGVVVFSGGMRRTNPVEIAVEPNPMASACILPPDDLFDRMERRLSAVEAQVVRRENVQSEHMVSGNNPHGVTKAQVGLAFADNTADMDKPISHAVQAALDAKVSTENFFIDGETMTVAACYAQIPAVFEINTNLPYQSADGVYRATYGIFQSEIVRVTSPYYIQLGISLCNIPNGTMAAIHCDNRDGILVSFNFTIYDKKGPISNEPHRMQQGDLLLLYAKDGKIYLAQKAAIAFSDGTYTATLPPLKEDCAMGTAVWHDATEFLPNTPYAFEAFVSGDVMLSANGRYAYTVGGDCRFILPKDYTGDTDGRIEVILHVPYLYNILFEAPLFSDGRTPVFSVGCYKIICVFDVICGKWCVSATSYREDWHEALGLRADFENNVFERLEAAVGKSKGADFDAYAMYGGRRRCNVADDGTIIAYEGEDGYVTNGTNGQVMVYQPAFYYKMIPLVVDEAKIRKAEYYISEKPLVGFKRHPAFYDKNGDEIDYILLSAFEGSVYDVESETYMKVSLSAEAYRPASMTVETDKLSSVAGTLPVHGLSIDESKQLAKNRGENWYIDHMLSLSVNQWLAIIEIGSFNMRNGIGNGALDYKTRTGEPGVVYRKCENLWGNIGQYVDGVCYDADKNIFVATNYGTERTMGMPTGFLSASSGYVSAFGYSTMLDWAFLPAESTGTSALPSGCYYSPGGFSAEFGWMILGFSRGYTNLQGLFAYYGTTGSTDASGSNNPSGARLIYVPNAVKEVSE